MFQRVISTPYDLIILDEMFASAQAAMALAIQKKFNSKLALFATTESNELPSDLLQFVEDPNSKGTIYVAFGSIVTWTVAPPEVIEIFFDVFNSLADYRIIFSYNGAAADPLAAGLCLRWLSTQQHLVFAPRF
ncbi:unnamed protein product [Angiostrongylus costaricensis]|uniref:Glucuronosyltransferase n=1 Tax=Angiostrongylus costaricensis TaxID=334426 RepID=A0A158PF56_ANGCS|nr:unnamed protein product [Angiostrongylus costaricensis]